MNKHERFEVKHDGRFVVDKLTDRVVADNRTHDGLWADFFDPERDVRLGPEGFMPITEETKTFIERKNQKIAEKNPIVKEVFTSMRDSKEKGLTPTEIFVNALKK